jgi:hypothetical protein
MAKALLPMKPGQTSPVALDDDGFHIYHLIEIKDSKPGFEAGRQEVVDRLKAGIRESSYRVAMANEKVDITHLKNVKVAKATIRDDDDGSGKSSSDKNSDKNDDAEQKSRSSSRGNGRASENSSSSSRSTADSRDDSSRQSPSNNGSGGPALLRPYDSRTAGANQQRPAAVAAAAGSPAALSGNSGTPEYDLPVSPPGAVSAGKGATVQMPPGFQVTSAGGVGPQTGQQPVAGSAPQPEQKQGFLHNILSGFNHPRSQNP